MADKVELSTFTVTLLKQPPVPGTGPGVALRNAAFEEAYRVFGVDLPPSLPGGLSRVDIAMGSEAHPVLVVDYASDRANRPASLAYILIPARVYERAPDGRRRYMVIADSIERRLVGESVTVALARQASKGPKHPDGLTAIWEKADLLALVVATGLSDDELEAAVSRIA